MVNMVARRLLKRIARRGCCCSEGLLRWCAHVHNPLTRCSNTACAGLNGSHMVGLRNGVQDHVGMAWVTCAACCWGAHSCFERGASAGCHGLRCVWCVCGARASSRRRGLKRWERVCAQRVAHVCVSRARAFSSRAAIACTACLQPTPPFQATNSKDFLVLSGRGAAGALVAAR